MLQMEPESLYDRSKSLFYLAFLVLIIDVKSNKNELDSIACYIDPLM